MPWETRNGKGRYYTRSRKVAGRVVREYIGSGEAAEFVAKMDEYERVVREAELEALGAEMAEYDAMDQTLKDVAKQSQLLLAAELYMAGYRDHKGEWRLKRSDKRDEAEEN